jgi:hypothetical protein
LCHSICLAKASQILQENVLKNNKQSKTTHQKKNSLTCPSSNEQSASTNNDPINTTEHDFPLVSINFSRCDGCFEFVSMEVPMISMMTPNKEMFRPNERIDEM